MFSIWTSEFFLFVCGSLGRSRSISPFVGISILFLGLLIIIVFSCSLVRILSWFTNRGSWPDKDEFAVHSVPVHFRMASDHCWLNIFQKSFMMRSTIALLKGSNIGLIRLSFTLRSFDCRTLEKYSKITGSLGSPGIPSSSQSVSSSDNVASVCISIVESLKTVGDRKGVLISALVWWGLIEGKFWSCFLSKMLEYYSK